MKIPVGGEDVNPNQQDRDRCTPLSYAARHGWEEALGILLDREDVNANKPD